MPRRIGNDEFALGGSEIAVSHIDGDALLTLRSQTVGQQRKVHVFVSTTFRRFFDSQELIFENRLRVVQQTTDKRTLAVVDRASSGKTEKRGFGRVNENVHE